jgi:hypothetical protein
MAVRGISEAIEVYEVTGLWTLRTHFELSTRRGLTMRIRQRIKDIKGLIRLT